MYFNDFVQPPNVTYALRGKGAMEKQPNDSTAVYFDCELCQDDYYLLYAFFLRLKYGCGEYNNERQHLIAIYRDINSIMQQLAQGGTFFGHQYARAVGYAEYSTYLLSEDNLMDTIIKNTIYLTKRGFMSIRLSNI
ncbi:hypothetical protein FPZ43_02755 [Mucilaginibacter pallidiroseus]|uniref:Uncharacterized protein n=1 Tax=Mucilaginibacter pallidiroseus TaxID=2599295 RepID=A0A563UJ84_9SPHI|nr:hypothetical protein [Mucilaginibacter pallidiroseus]TWR31415.1 hypothetical protein FPZ43_02755 [Mucilaginibacter pallidiroseus]